jgi:hypothetical protein
MVAPIGAALGAFGGSGGLGLLGGAAGGGGGGGGLLGGIGGAIGGIGGGILGLGAGIAGALDTSQEDLLSDIKTQVRKGVRFSEAEAAQAAFAQLSSPEAIAFQNQIRGLYGLEATGGPGEVGFANPFQAGSRFFLADPSTLGKKRLSDLGRRRRRPVVQTAKQFAGISEALALEGGANLSAKEQRRVGEALDPGNLAAAFENLGQLSDTQRNLLAERLQTRFGMGAGSFEETFGEIATRTGNEAALAAGEAPGAAPGFGSLAGNIRANIQQAQQSRGLFFGQGPATAEAAGVGAFETQLRLSNLGLLQQAAGMPQQLFQQALAPALQKNVFERTGGAVAFGQANPMLSQAAPGVGGRIREGIFDTISGAALGAAAGKSIFGG